MRLRDLFKRFRLAFPVFGILLGSCSGSLNLPTMNRKNALPDGASYFTDGMVIGSMYIGNPSSVSSSGAVLRFTNLASTSSTVIYGSGSNSNLYPGFYSNPGNWINGNVTNTEDVVSHYAFGAVPASIDTSNRNVTFYFTDPVRVDILSQDGYDAIRDSWYVPAGDLVSDAYNYGESAGYSNGYAVGNSVGYSEGYSAGFEGASLVEQTINVTCADGSGYNIFNYSVSLDGVVTSTGVIDSGYRNGLKVTRDPSKVLSITFTYAGDLNLRCIPSVSGNDELIVLPTFLQVDGVYYLPYWWATVDIELKSTTAPDFPTSPVFTLDNSAIEQVLIGYSYREITDARTEGYTSGYDAGYTEGYDSGYYEMSVIADSEIAQTSTQAYNDGRASVGTEETAITNLLGSIVSVPISVLNGLMPLAIWNTPIISILVTLMVVALVLWLVRVLI